MFEFVVAVAAGVAILIIWSAASYAKDRIWPKEVKELPKEELKVDRTIDFQGWKPTGQMNDLEFSDGQLFLDPASYAEQGKNLIRDPQGYIQSPSTISENSFVCAKFTPLTGAIDLTLRSRDSFQITIGDGDNQSIKVKQFSSTNPNWEPVLPDDSSRPYTDQQGRYILESPLPIGKDATACLTINSKPGGTVRQVTAELSIFGHNNEPVAVAGKPSWTMRSDSKINGLTNFSIGLIDSRRDKPLVKLESYCAVEMKNEKPNDLEMNACKNP